MRAKAWTGMNATEMQLYPLIPHVCSVCSIPPKTFIRHLHSHTTSNFSQKVITEVSFQEKMLTANLFLYIS